MDLEVLGKDGAATTVTVDDRVFAAEVKEHLFYEAVKMQLAGRRRGTASTKTRAEVSGGGRKPWRQKGTGRARAGTTRSPLWRHGGVVFGPRPRDYSYTIPASARKAAMRSALSLKVKEGRLKISESLEPGEPRTKAALKLMKDLGVESALVVVEGDNKNLRLGLRNLKDFKVIRTEGLNVYDILNYEYLVTTKEGLERIEALAK